MISIITPCYNSVDFISQTIDSVIAQTYTDWEMIIVDDNSKDNSPEIIQAYCRKDPRIKYIRTERPSGSPTLPRNIGLKHARGRFIAFLDSDDMWLPTKLEEQLKLFRENKVAIVYSNYEKISEEGKRGNRIIKAPAKADYKTLLKGNVMGCLTVMYDSEKVGKRFFDSIGHEDYAVWLSILKEGYTAKNTNTVTALYRVRRQSVSSNKWDVLSWQWNIYVKVEKTGIPKAIYYFINYAVRAFLKRIK
ncbi:MAG: glycosyltransferase family 2 protein [Bacteroidales bacterium]|jgi:teichuronic acid biosynthesis glycosyltransferase TuaG|nr:glycosyltransferase family 2 protein [Bacteroidota bacterium]NLV39341.1 glycosyltransferase family 2 protein [Bacteroidales bacterium]HOD27262.1 glycosyltransferase family 2 protein [Bacteroidales bacterium]HQM93868.1 glycosyltransferase family 2 protein [Bacteroidales bacterium]